MNWSVYICSAQSRNLRHLEIALRILRILKLHANLEIAHWVYAISRLRGTGVQSRDSTISVACIIEPFEFPSYIKVSDIHNKLLQLLRHLQCILKPPHQRLLGSSLTQRNSLPLGTVWVRAQRDPRLVECPCSRHHHL